MTTTQSANIIQLSIGDEIPIGNIIANLILMGIVTDVNNPNMFAATMEAFQGQAALTVPVLQGPKGDPGAPSFALRWQNDNKTQPSQLPTDLGDTVADLGKYWVFGIADDLGHLVETSMFIWWGTSIGFRQLPIGTPGPPGPYPMIAPTIVLEAPGSGNGPGGVDSWVGVSGTASNPSFVFHIAAPEGIAGPSAALFTCPDVDMAGWSPGDSLIISNRVTPGAPTGFSLTPSATGGTLAAGDYFYCVTAILANGETAPTAEIEVTLTGTTSSVHAAWFAPAAGCKGYRLYRGNIAFTTNVLVAEISSGTTLSFTDTGAATSPGSPPSEGVVAGLPIWVPQAPVLYIPQFYTIPEAAFTSIEGIGGASQPVCTFPVPQQPWPWKPWVVGQMQIFGANISLTPLLVGAQVLLGSPTTGTEVGRGYGNSLGYVTFIPQASSSGNPSAAITPTNTLGKVPANHTGSVGTLYINLINTGMAGVYDFNSANAQMGVLIIPCP